MTLINFPVGKGFGSYRRLQNLINKEPMTVELYMKTDGVKIIHKGFRSHGKRYGASAYRLDWNGMSVAFTGDGRPN